MNFKKLHSNSALAFALVMVLSFTGCSDDDVVEIVGDCPIVLSTIPEDGDTDVPLDQVITVTFNEGIDPETINEQTFTVDGTSSVAGTVTFSDNTASFTPAADLEPYITYTGTVTTAIKDLMGNALQENYVWSFTTIPEVSLSATPEVGGTILGAGSFSNGSSVTVAAMPNEGYIFTNWTVDDTEVSTSTSYQFEMDGNIALVANFEEVVLGNLRVNLSSSPIEGGTTEGSGQFSANSNVTVTALPNPGYVFVNWTEGETVASTSSSYQFDLTENRTLVANYSPLLENQLAVILSANPAIGGSTNGSGSFDAQTPVTVTATPNTGYVFVNWTADQEEVSTDASYTFDLIANTSLVANFEAGTNAGEICPNPAVDLGMAGNYAILAKSGISTTGATSITGDMGVSPITSTAVTGFGLTLSSDGTFSSSSLVTGKIFAADYTSPTPVNLTTAVDNMQTAFTTANGLAPDVVELMAGNLNGQTLASGVYKWGTGLLITNEIILDGGGVDCAEFVFQIAGDLTISPNTKITLINGAKADNIFWVVAGAGAVIDTDVDFSGNILSKTLISVNTRSSVNGRLLAQSGVTLDANAIVKPSN